MTATMSIFANATGGLQPKASAPDRAPINKYKLLFVLSFSNQAPFKKHTMLQTIMQTPDIIAVQ